jgi:CRP-like cAMP-binding protein
VKIGLSTPDGKELVIALLGRDEFFGDMALLDGEPRSADAIAKTDCQLLLLNREDFLSFLDTHPKVAANLLANLSRRLRLNTTMLQEAAFLDIPARVASALLQLAEDDGRPAPDGSVVIDSAMTQAELAGMVGATRESVNKWLRYYERQGLIHWAKGAVAILKPDDLRRRVY